MSAKFKLIIFLAIFTLGFCSIIPFDEANVIDLQPESSDIEDDLFPSAPELDFLNNEEHPRPAAISSRPTTSRTSSTPSGGYTTSKPTYCGIGSQTPSDDEEDEFSRIVGGTPTRPNEFPWQAFVRSTMTTGTIQDCGGSLIANRWILTSARCLLSPGQKLKSVTVYLGAHNITAYEMNRKRYSGMQAFFHPDWNQTTLAGDIALIKLYSVVTFSRYIRPICLANSIEPDYVNSNVVITGWGKPTASNSYLSPVLRKATVPVISNVDCRVTYGNIVTSKIMCTSGYNYRGVCNGDGGGPMNYQQSNGRWKQIGIASFGYLGNCQSGRPYGYTRLSSYSTWVQGVVQANSMSSSPARSTPTTPSPSSSSIINAGSSSAVLFLLVSFVSLLMNF